jgi:hypothetical protein
MRRSIAATAVAMSMALSMMSAGSSSATDEKSAPDTPDARQLTADRALTTAHDILSGRASDGAKTPTGATLALRDLFVALPDLDGAERKQAESVLARPTDGASDPNGDGYAVPAKKKCKGNICMHWVSSTADAPPGKGWVNKNLKTMNQVWKHEVGKLNFRRPVKDGRRGGNKKFDVYLKELGSEGLYGYCAPERRRKGTKWLASGYCVLDNDFAQVQYGAPPVQSLRVTAAHEFFHAVQFAYDYGEDPWFMEATATWMEERFADGVNDNRQYLPYGQVKQSSTSLDVFNPQGFNQYGNWPFFEFLSTRYGKGIVHQIWNRAGAFKGAPDAYSSKAITSVMRRHGGFSSMFARYSAGNTIPAGTYPEGKHWPKATIAKRWKLSPSHKKAGKAFQINHLSSRNVLVKPASTLRKKKWMLRVIVNGPDRKTAPTAYVIVKRKHGHAIKRAVHLSPGGHGKIKVPFSSRKVRNVTVTLANASTRFKCWKGTNYSCRGKAKDNGKKYQLKVVAFKH